MSYERAIRVPVRRWRWRGPIVLLVLLALLTWATLWAWRTVRGPETDPTVRACVAGTAVQAADVTVDVLNSTPRVGLARRTADALAARGFVIGTVGDYEGSRVRSVAVVRSGRQGRAAAALVRQQLPQSEVQVNDAPGRTVILILGAAYRSLAPVPTVAPRC